MVRSALRIAAATGLIAALGGVTLTLPSTPAAAAPTPAPVTPDTAMRDAAATLSTIRSALLAAPGDVFTPRSAVVDPNGTRHVRVTRTYQGLPVAGGESIGHYRVDGTLRSVTNALATPLTLSVTPRLDAAKAGAIAAGYGKPAAATLYVDALATPTLAWDVAVPQPGATLHVFVDATTGAVLRTDNGVRTLRSGGTATSGQRVPSSIQAGDPPPGDTPPCCENSALGTGSGWHVGKVPINSAFQLGLPQIPISYYLKDRTRGGHKTRDSLDLTESSDTTTDLFTDGDNYWGSGTLASRATVAVDAQYGAAVTWDFYKNVLGRNGIADNGVGARSFVHYVFYFQGYGYYTDNAGWSDDCFCMLYGDGGGSLNLPPITSIDVAGHEMTHGVTSETANLVYNGEPGGLNESTSDIFGTMVEFHANNAVDTPDFKIGEKVFGTSTPLRWMDDPTKDNYSKGCWYSGVGNIDVHFSSGIGNHFFFMLANGSGSTAYGTSPTCNSAPAVTGIGLTKAGKIWYQALAAHMVSNENYAKARISTINAANDLYGGTECEAVKAAWTAVNVVAGAMDPACGAATAVPTLNNPGNRVSKKGTAVSIQLSGSDPQGEALTYSATGLPDGLSISTAGLITGTPTTPGAKIGTITVTDASANSDSADINWTITGTSGCMSGTWVKNRGFESGSTSWSASLGVIGQESGGANDPAHDGTWRANLGGHNFAHTDTLSQSIAIPSVNCGSVKIHFYYYITTDSIVAFASDVLTVKLGGTTAGTLSNLDDLRGYTEKVYTVTPTWGTSQSLSFTSVENSSLATWFNVDDVFIEIP